MQCQCHYVGGRIECLFPQQILNINLMKLSFLFKLTSHYHIKYGGQTLKILIVFQGMGIPDHIPLVTGRLLNSTFIRNERLFILYAPCPSKSSLNAGHVLRYQWVIRCYYGRQAWNGDREGGMMALLN